jgi:hypothetical protein
MKKILFTLLSLLSLPTQSQNKNPLATEIITSDLNNFWIALEKAETEVNADALDKYYLQPGSKGIKAFMEGRIKNSENLARVIKSHSKYYHSIKTNVDSIAGMKSQIIQALVKLKDLYPDAIFPPVYFVIGALNSGGTSSDAGLIIGAEMYGLNSKTPKDFQQNYNDNSLLAACVKEGAADFLAELISGKHINEHVHNFANPKEKELWKEFKTRMDKKDYKGWLYGTVEGRPNDLGYWMGYKITKAYFDQASDKKEAVNEILNIKDFHKFLDKSGYALKFD